MLKTSRLVLRHLCLDDAPFIVELLNDPSFIRYIGDRGVRDVADACRYITDGPIASYRQFGFGLFLVELAGSAVPIGMCGLLKREFLPDVDIGFAFLPRFRAQGYAIEAAAAVKDYARDVVELGRIVAVTNPDNDGSLRVLEKLGFELERMVRMPGDSFDIKLLGVALSRGVAASGIDEAKVR